MELEKCLDRFFAFIHNYVKGLERITIYVEIPSCLCPSLFENQQWSNGNAEEEVRRYTVYLASSNVE